MSTGSTEFPGDVVVVRFGTRTPFFPLSMTYGMLFDPSIRTWFLSLDHYIGYHMLCRPDDKRRIMASPNGWIAYQNLNNIVETALHHAGDPVIRPDWEQVRDGIMLRGVQLKISQHSAVRDMLIKTRDRPIVDESRAEETHWCNARGLGNNRHAHLLEDVRTMVRNGELVEFRAA